MLKLFTGNINEALQVIGPDVCLNVCDARGTGVHPLSNVLFRDYPEYNEMLTSLRYANVNRNDLPGRYLYRNTGTTTHVIGFIDHNQISTTDGELFNMPLVTLFRALSSSMMSGHQRTIVVPYYGLRTSGYHFLDFLEMLEMVFHKDITVYISVSEQYTHRTELECLRFNSPIIENGKHTIYQKKSTYTQNQRIYDQFFNNNRFVTRT